MGGQCCIRHMRHGPLLGTRVPRCSAPAAASVGMGAASSGLWSASRQHRAESHSHPLTNRGRYCRRGLIVALSSHPSPIEQMFFFLLTKAAQPIRVSATRKHPHIGPRTPPIRPDLRPRIPKNQQRSIALTHCNHPRIVSTIQHPKHQEPRPSH